VGEDNCLAPLEANKHRVTRVVRNEFFYDRPTKILYRVPNPIEGDRKDVTITYGKSDDVANNRAGRQIEVNDVASKTTILGFHPIGLPESTQRVLKSSNRKSSSDHISDVGTLADTEVYDAWGLLRFSTLVGIFAGLKDDGSK
jgi:hypothetical protein